MTADSALALTALVADLAATTRAQTVALERRSLEAFAELLAQREVILARLQQADLRELSPADLAILGETVALDTENQARIARWQAEVGQSLRVIQQGRRALRGYGGPIG
jgi:hypothetical protein